MWTLPPLTSLPTGGTVLGGVSRQQPRNALSCCKVDASKVHTDSQQTVTNTHNTDLLSQSRKLVTSMYFIYVLELPSLQPCSLSAVPALRSSQTLSPITPDSSNLFGSGALSPRRKTWDLNMILDQFDLPSLLSKLPPRLCHLLLVRQALESLFILSPGSHTYIAHSHFGPTAIRFLQNINLIWSLPAENYPIDSQCP